MLFGLPNLISKTVSPCVPWTFTVPIPDEVKGKTGKKARDSWINNPETSHLVYSAFEGLNEGLRISSGKGVEEENPPFRLHAFIADIDCPVSDDELAAGLARLKFTPNYFERTLSGNARLIWLFEAPVTFPSRKFAIEFLELALVRIKADQIAAALDKPAWLEPNRYYTSSCDFYTIDAGARIGTALLQGWMLEVAEKHLWKKEKNAVAIPLPIVFAEIEKKFPQHGWQGDFVVEAQGPTFWLAGSVSPKSAIVKPTGLFTFSSSASRSFYSWADLLGDDFVKTYETEMLGKAVENIFHDGKNYYRKDGHGDWKPFTKEDIQSHLIVTRGLGSNKEGDRPSECSRAMEYLKDWQAITGAAPFVFQPTGLVVKNGFKFLNTHTRRPLAPVPIDTPVKWGVDGQFPFVSQYWDGLLDPPEQLPFLLAWVQRFYRGAFEQNLESGQNVFLLGPAGIGKTLMSQGILTMLMGGSAEAEDYLLGKTQFNSELFEVGLWTVDDNSATIDAATHRKFTAMAKKMAANTTFAYHAKFRVPCAVDWLGRVIVTGNDDEESVRIVPDLSQSNLDKTNLFRSAKTAPVKYPPRRELQKILKDELPYFARWLLNWETPVHVLDSSRFGIKAYHEASLLIAAEQSSRTAGFLEIIEDWRQTYFYENPKLEYWEGSSFQLLRALNKDSLGSAAGIRNLTADLVGRGLASLRAKGLPFEPKAGKLTRDWRIYAPGKEPAVALPVSTASDGLSTKA